MPERIMKRSMTLLLMGLLAACTPAAEGVQHAGETLKASMADNAAAWKELLTYHPTDTTPQLPQTRYCYKSQTDIVCYDSPQRDLTSRMVGYQDGDNISWVQPGGGSTGVSGGEPTAPANAKQVMVAPNLAGTAAVINTAPEPEPQQVSSMEVTETPQAPALPSASNDAVPFEKGHSSYAGGAKVN